MSNLGINLNLSPVVDISTNSSDYMHQRTLGQNAELTAVYAKTVIKASKGNRVSYTLKHFPGYGNNTDTHTGSSTDTRTYHDIYSNDLVPFRAGIEEGAEAVLISHNIVTSIDNKNPASLSVAIHNLLRKDLNFTGIIITDDLTMSAIPKDENAVLKAIQAGNNIIITNDYKNSIQSVKQALEDGTLQEDLIDYLVFRILAWKYYKELLY